MAGTQRHGPYAALIGRAKLGHPVGESEINRLPDPEAYRDARFLARFGSFSATDLNDADALTVSLLWKMGKT